MSSNSNSNYSPRPDWRTERNLLQNFNQVSNKKLKTISLANALKQMKMENDKSKKVRKQLKFNSNSKPSPKKLTREETNKKLKKLRMNAALKRLEQYKKKKEMEKSKPKK
jgi:hypothetical protein|tara:strand:+ start:63 stop:392 length:330 start_codon:yes stop_codon:yes gene_type:complete